MNAVSLYAHIPFCAQKCGYCDFFSVPSRGGVPDEYVASLLSEAAQSARAFGVDAWSTLYLGGGTPSLLSAAQLVSLVRGLGEVRPFLPGAEITVEMNPESVRRELVEACASCGVNRISLGVQALDGKALSAVGRAATPGMALDALSLLEEAWDGRLSVDFIAGLPLQTRSSFVEQFQAAFRFKKIDHVSLYTLTVEDGTPLAEKIAGRETAFSCERADSLWIAGRDILERHGFLQYEVSNFARPGFKSRHNESYWKLRDYVGIGAGASGTVYGRSLRWSNTADIGAYCAFWSRGGGAGDDGLSAVRTVEVLDERTMMFEYAMMGFRLREGISERDFFRRFGKTLAGVRTSGGETAGNVFARWAARGLLVARGRRGERQLFLSRDGILLLNRFLEELL